MPTKRATPVVIETPFPSVEQVVQSLRVMDDDTAPSKPAFHRYGALTKWLRRQKQSPLQVSFEDLEDDDKGIGMVLPYTAWDRTWWTNERDPESRQSRAWLNAGWKVQSVDPERELVVFVRF